MEGLAVRMEGQDAGDRYLGAPGPVDMDARENGVKADVSRRQHESDEQLAKLIDHKKIQRPVVNIRPGESRRPPPSQQQFMPDTK